MNCPLCTGANCKLWVQSADEKRYWKCGNCHLVWLEKSQRPTAEAEVARYREHHNSTYSPEYLEYLGRTAFPVADCLSSGASGLDYGSGPVAGMQFLLNPLGYKVATFDPFFFPDFDLLKNSYDFILCSEAAEHFFQPEVEFDRFDAMLVPGGWLGISSRLVVSREEFPDWYYRRDPTHVSFYSEATVQWIARCFGWELHRLESPLWLLRKPISE
jgi:hypothetical protein